MGPVCSAPYTNLPRLSLPHRNPLRQVPSITSILQVRKMRLRTMKKFAPKIEPQLVSSYNRAQTWLCLPPHRAAFSQRDTQPEEGFNSRNQMRIQDHLYKPTCFTLFLTCQRVLQAEEELKLAESQKQRGPNCLLAG